MAHSPRLTYEGMHALAQSRGLHYRGSTRPKAMVAETWECARGHYFKTYARVIQRIPMGSNTRNGCVHCNGTSPNYSLEDNGRLGPRLMALGLDLMGRWNGIKNRSFFRCRGCSRWWADFGLSVFHHGRKCRHCFPLRKLNRSITLNPPLLLLPYYPADP